MSKSLLNNRRTRRGRRFRLAVENLEERTLFSVEAVTVIDPTRWGLSGLGVSQAASLSDDGQIVAFQSDAPDLVTNDFNGLADVFVYHRGTGRVQLVSVNSTGTGSGNALAKNPRVSPDGRYVLFESSASNLITGVSGPQLYARDLQSMQTILISKNDSGVAGNGLSQNAQWSGDSTWVVFESTGSNLSPFDNNTRRDVFIRDLGANSTTLVSINRGNTASGNGHSYSPQISRNGKVVTFLSGADDLVLTDFTAPEDVYVRDLAAGTTEMVSVNTDGIEQALHPSLTANAINPDGRFVMFLTSAGFGSIPLFNGSNLFLRDRQLGTTTLVSVNTDGTAGVGGFPGAMSTDGRYVTFVSNAEGLDAAVDDTNATYDVFRRDMVAGTTRMVTINLNGTNGGDGQSFSPLMTGDGRYIGFVSEAGDLSNDPDGNQGQALAANRRDVFVRDMQTGVSVNLSAGGSHQSQVLTSTPDLQWFAFETSASNLVPGDRSERQDIVVRPRNAGAIELASRRDPSLPEEILNGGGLYSATPDGRYVAFHATGLQGYAPDVTFQGVNTGLQASSAYVKDRVTGAIQVVDLTPNPSISSGGFSPIITPNGRFVAFLSRVPIGFLPPLVDGITFEGDAVFAKDVYVRDLATGVTKLVSIDPTGTHSSNGSDTPEHAISDDGRYVAFTSNSTNLVPGISNPNKFAAVYLRDLWTGQTVLVSRNLAADGTITGSAFNLSMTGDGRIVTFASRATDLAPDDTNNQADVFQWDRETGVVTLVSVKATENKPGSNDSGGQVGFRPVTSKDGRYVAFGSRANDLVAGDTNGQDDIFLRDMQTGQTSLVSVNTAGTNGGNRRSLHPSVSADGRTVSFLSLATNLTAIPLPVSAEQVFVRQMDSGITVLATPNVAGNAASNGAAVLSPSAQDLPTLSPVG